MRVRSAKADVTASVRSYRPMVVRQSTRVCCGCLRSDLSPRHGPRMASAIVRIERELNEGDFIRRLKAPVDGSAEGSFLAWFTDVVARWRRLCGRECSRRSRARSPEIPAPGRRSRRRRLHFFLDAGTDEPPVNGIARGKPCEHGELHCKPELGARDSGDSPLNWLEPPELDDGHQSIHAHLPRRDGGNVRFDGGQHACSHGQASHRLDREVLKDDAQ